MKPMLGHAAARLGITTGNLRDAGAPIFEALSGTHQKGQAKSLPRDHDPW